MGTTNLHPKKDITSISYIVRIKRQISFFLNLFRSRAYIIENLSFNIVLWIVLPNTCSSHSNTVIINPLNEMLRNKLFCNIVGCVLIRSLLVMHMRFQIIKKKYIQGHLNFKFSVVRHLETNTGSQKQLSVLAERLNCTDIAEGLLLSILLLVSMVYVRLYAVFRYRKVSDAFNLLGYYG